MLAKQSLQRLCTTLAGYRTVVKSLLKKLVHFYKQMVFLFCSTFFQKNIYLAFSLYCEKYFYLKNNKMTIFLFIIIFMKIFNFIFGKQINNLVCNIILKPT
jgi:hypothetical protein